MSVNMDPTPSAVQRGGEESPSASARGARPLPGRREVVRQGIKLAFVAPVLSTFFAKDAIAAGSGASCYPNGQDCGSDEACCSGDCDIGGTDKCVPL